MWNLSGLINWQLVLIPFYRAWGRNAYISKRWFSSPENSVLGGRFTSQRGRERTYNCKLSEVREDFGALLLITRFWLEQTVNSSNCAVFSSRHFQERWSHPKDVTLSSSFWSLGEEGNGNDFYRAGAVFIRQIWGLTRVWSRRESLST